MGILGRINSVIKSNLNAVLDNMTDPGKEIDLLIVEMEENLKKAKEEVITSLAGAKRTGMRGDELQREAEQWQRRAEQAVRAGDDSLAREALTKQMEITRELSSLRRAEQEQRSYSDELKVSLSALEARIKEVKARKETLKVRARAAKEGRTPLQGGRAFEDFNRLEDRIEAMETEGDLTASTDGRDAALAAKFSHLEAENPQVEDALAELKRKMDKE
jgi:phage shock protein A